MFVVADLAANFSRREGRRVDVGIGGIGLNDLGKISENGRMHVLGRGADHTGCGQRAGNAYAGRPGPGQAGVPAGPLPKLVHKNTDMPPGT